MFKKLKLRLLLFNIGILSVLMLIVFSSLYLSVYSNVNQRIERELNQLLGMPLEETINPDIDLDPMLPRDTTNLGSFVLLVDDGVIVASSMQNDIESGLMTEALESIDGDEGDFDLGEDTWGYKLNVITDSRSKIAFVNITRDKELLQSSITTYIFLFIGTIMVTAIVSAFLTNRSIKPIKESFDKQKEFVANASHELKTPLTVINTNIDVLLSSGESKNTKWLSYIKSEVLRMNKLTQDLLYLANVDEENQIQMNSFNSTSALESVLLGIEALCFEKELVLTYDLEPECTIMFNEQQFIQLSMILLDNAIKYTPRKGTIYVNLAKKNKNTIITVENSGKGISNEELPYLFDRFYKSDKSRKNNNNSFGLGLSIAKAIVNNHNAKITVESMINEYTKFSVKI